MPLAAAIASLCGCPDAVEVNGEVVEFEDTYVPEPDFDVSAPADVPAVPGLDVPDVLPDPVCEKSSDCEAVLTEPGPCQKVLCTVKKQCIYVVLEDGVPCDGDTPCYTGQQCSGGFCLGGVATDCNDGNNCTSDECDAEEGCVHIPRIGPCSDGDECTTGEYCQEGVCGGGIDECPAQCGNGKCQTTKGETCQSCELDCGLCPDGCSALEVPGCDSCACESCVCAANPACCDTLWDEACATLCAGCGTNCTTCTEDGDCEGQLDPPGPCASLTCTEDGRCEQKDLADETPCDDGDPCTDGEACASGVCAGGKDVCTVVCGDDTCQSDGGETCESCPSDCGPCPSGCEATEGAGCGGCGCETCVCDDNPFCCDVAWDESCVVACQDCGQGCTGCTESEAPGCGGCACEACVCDLVPSCCTDAWIPLCVTACETQCGGTCP